MHTLSLVLSFSIASKNLDLHHSILRSIYHSTSPSIFYPIHLLMYVYVYMYIYKYLCIPKRCVKFVPHVGCICPES